MTADAFLKWLERKFKDHVWVKSSLIANSLLVLIVAPVQTPDKGTVIEVTDLGGLHHHYFRLAA